MTSFVDPIPAAELESLVMFEEYFPVPNTTITICVLSTAGGYPVRGESSCRNPAMFDAVVGRRLAREKAMSRLSELEAYRRSFDRPRP